MIVKLRTLIQIIFDISNIHFIVLQCSLTINIVWHWIAFKLSWWPTFKLGLGGLTYGNCEKLIHLSILNEGFIE